MNAAAYRTYLHEDVIANTAKTSFNYSSSLWSSLEAVKSPGFIHIYREPAR